MKRLFVIHDTVADAIIEFQMYALLSFRTIEQATRYFADGINDKTSVMHKHPADYNLLIVGSVDDDGQITPMTPQIIVNGKEITSTQEEPLQLHNTGVAVGQRTAPALNLKTTEPNMHENSTRT